MNGQRFHQQKRIEMKTEYCERGLILYLPAMILLKLNLITRVDFAIQYHQSLSFTPQVKAISECRQKKFSQAEIQNKPSRKATLKPARQTLVWCGRREVFKRRYVLITKEEG